MKKLLSIVLLIANYNTILFSRTSKDQNKTYFKFDENTKIWKSCKEINNDEAECIDISEYLEKMVATSHLFKQNEKQAKELVKNIAIAQVQYHYLTLKMNFENSQKEQNLSKEEQQATQLEFEKLYADLKGSLSPSSLNEWMKNQNNPEYVRSILPEEEQKTFDAIKEMSSKLQEKTENKN